MEAPLLQSEVKRVASPSRRREKGNFFGQKGLKRSYLCHNCHIIHSNVPLTFLSFLYFFDDERRRIHLGHGACFSMVVLAHQVARFRAHLRPPSCTGSAAVRMHWLYPTSASTPGPGRAGPHVWKQMVTTRII